MHFGLEILMNIWRRDVIWKFISYVVFKACSEEVETEHIVERTLVLEKGHVDSITWDLFFLGFLH